MKRTLGRLFCTLMVLLAGVLPACADESARRVVRVAFPEQEGMSHIGRTGKVTGYNYDYLEKISEYTGWEMEYVAYPSQNGNEAVSAALQDLVNGKVDLLGPLLKNTYTEENFELPENSYGTVYTTLNALQSSSLHENNIQNMRLLRVGLWEQASTRNAEVLSFLESSNLNYTVLYFGTSDEQVQALVDGRVDVISSVSLTPFDNTRIVARFAPRSYYFAAPKGQTELIEALNEAIQEIDYVQPTLQDALFDRYFRNTENTFVLSETDRAYLEQMDELNVLCIDYDAPYVYQENGQPKGMLISILDDFSAQTGVALHYAFCATRSEANDLLKNGGFDLLIGFPFDSDYCSEHGFVRSESIVESGLSYVRSLDNDKKDTIAVVRGVQDWIDTSAYANVILFDNAKQCIDAINSRQADAAAGDRSIMEYYIYDTASRLTTSLITGETQKVGVGVSKGSGVKLMEILNRYIDSLSDVEITLYLSEGNTHASSGALVRYIRQYPAQATAIVVALTAVVATGVFMMLYARQMNRKNRQLQKANEARSEFLSRMSHDMRTPMNGILGLLEMADSEVGDAEKTKRYHAKIHRAFENLLSLTNDVMDMNELEHRNGAETEESVSLSDVIRDSVELIAAKAAEKQIVLVTPEDFAPPRVMSCWSDLQRVWLNVLDNAVQFSKPGGTVRLDARVLEQTETAVSCRFSVTDEGIGISREFQKKMFEPFTQEHGGARTEYRGTGLGLSITKRIIERMGGSIQVQSEENKGTCISWTLTFKPDTNQTGGADAHGTLAGLHVLAAEDNALNAEVLAFMLEDAGAQVTMTQDGAQAVEAFEQSDEGFYDVILTDIMMPVMSGNEASRKIRALGRADAQTIPIIALSANAMPMDREKSLDSGITAYETKPLDMERLAKLIRKLVKEK